MTLRVVVVDDERLPRQRLLDLVSQHASLTLVGEASNGAEALDVLVDVRPDVVFLDIQMPELDGFQVVAALGDDALPAIVFVTAYDEYAIRAFEVDAIDYLLKPVTPERFAAAVARVCSRAADRDQSESPARALAVRVVQERGFTTRFVARRGAKHYFVRVADADWIEAVGNYVRLHTGETSHLIRQTMKGAESRLDPAAFVRVHRSAIVAVDRIRSIEAREHGEYVVTLAGGVRLVSSRTYSGRVRALLR
ncbi:MAG: LytTR family DNA-binding domain-containing protein [bacterium]